MKETAPALWIAAVLFWVTGYWPRGLGDPGRSSPRRARRISADLRFDFKKDIQRVVERQEGWEFPTPGCFYSLGPDRLVPLSIALAVLGLLETAAEALIWFGDRHRPG